MVKLNGVYSPTDSIKGFIPQRAENKSLVLLKILNEIRMNAESIDMAKLHLYKEEIIDLFEEN